MTDIKIKPMFKEITAKTGKYNKKRICKYCGYIWYPRLKYSSIICPCCNRKL